MAEDSESLSISRYTAQCLSALHELSSDAGLQAIANAASTDVPKDAILAAPHSFAVDIGNYDLCIDNVMASTASRLHHCLAGSLLRESERSVPLTPFAGFCIPVQCDASSLMEINFKKHIISEIGSMIEQTISVNTSQLTVPLLSTQRGQQRFSYYTKLSNIIDAVDMSGRTYTCGDNQASMTVDRSLFLSLLGLLIVVVIVFTLWDMSKMRVNNGSNNNKNNDNNNNSNNNNNKSKSNKNISNSGGDESNKGTYVSIGVSPTSATPLRKAISGSSRIEQLIHTFSLIQNFPLVFKAAPKGDGENGEGDFSVLDGLRAISILWVCLGHVFALVTSNGIMNPQSVMPPTGLLTSIPAQILTSSRFAVDTFFFISGFLVVASLLKRLNGSENTPPISHWLPFFYLHRILRILPPFTFCLLLWWKIGVMLGSGPFWFRWLGLTTACDRYFWTNFLFVNNLYPYSSTETDECFYVSWYLANDMQFYAVSPLFVLLFLKNKWLGIATSAAVVSASVAMTYHFTIRYGWSAHSLDGLAVTKYAIGFYTKPLFRAVPYFVGVLSAMVWHIKATVLPTFRLPAAASAALLSSAVACISYLVFGFSSAYQQKACGVFETPGQGLCGSNWSLAEHAAYNSFSKLLWSLALSMLTLVCGNGQGYAVQSFLSHRIFVPVARVSFSIYLLHVTIINIIVFSRTQKLHYNKIDFLMLYFGIVVLSFIIGVVVTVLIENPMLKIGISFEIYLKSRLFRPGGQTVKTLPLLALGERGLGLGFQEESLQHCT